MRMIMGGVNGEYLRDIVEQSVGKTEQVVAAVAYATTSDLLFDSCFKRNIPVKFWGRFDETSPVSIPVLKKFLESRSPNFVCKLVRQFHPKIIWWQGFGVYIGSANLTNSAWYRNFEAGCFYNDSEVAGLGIEMELQTFFRKIDEKASPLTNELFEWMEARAKSNARKQKQEKDEVDKFLETDLVQSWEGMAVVGRKQASEQRREAFMKEWFEALQYLRDIADIVDRPENRPDWLGENVPAGSHADQFLHAHYYNRTFDDRRAAYEDHHNANKGNIAAALSDAVSWWKSQETPPSNEDVTLHEWAPIVRDLLSEEKLKSLSGRDFREVCLRVHSMRDHARRVANKVLGLPGDREYTIEEKTHAFADYLMSQTSQGGHTILGVLHHVLYGGPRDQTPYRMWQAISEPEWQLDHLGVSALGEIVGWALPNDFPPRNGRTSKALRSLGYDVTVHTA
ncbi:MAG: phospholipase D-like domain-containing protein [Rhodospirillales bacterium]